MFELKFRGKRTFPNQPPGRAFHFRIDAKSICLVDQAMMMRCISVGDVNRRVRTLCLRILKELKAEHIKTEKRELIQAELEVISDGHDRLLGNLTLSVKSDAEGIEFVFSPTNFGVRVEWGENEPAVDDMLYRMAICINEFVHTKEKRSRGEKKGKVIRVIRANEKPDERNSTSQTA